ncbi:MAG: O-antigen ligase family protein, partial [Pyrinomonadaceae bacterium]|nr:O-antigen ligase family protein [Pyrinomonadaceae bacterium]
MLTKLSRRSPFFLAAFWSLLLLANFVPTVPQPAVIIGYLWKVEFALAGLIVLTLLAALQFPQNKVTAANFSKRELYWIILPLILFTLWSGVSIIWAESPRNALHHTLLWACYALFYILVRQIVARPKLLDVSLKVAGVVVSILGIACLTEYLSSYPDIGVLFTYRYYKYAEASVMLLPIYLALSLRLKDRAAFFSGLVAVIAWLIILLSFSRTEFIAGCLCIGLFFALVLTFQNFKIYRRKLLWLFLALLIPALLTQTSILKSAETSTVSRFADGEVNQKNLQWRLLVWGITLESFKRKPLQGIGADNFAVDYRNAQESYADSNPQSKLLEIDQNVIPERTHNEYLQILAELGSVGILLFGWLLVGIGSFLFSIRRRKVSVLSLAALAGIFAFLVSSLASSYSFRVPANGVCFFFLLALAANEFFKKGKSETVIEENEKKYEFGFWKFKPALISGGLLIGGAMLIFSAVRGASLMYLQAALDSSDKTAAEADYQKAIALDDREPLFRYYYGSFLYNQKRAAEAISPIRWAIDHGISTSINYFNLAAAQTVSHQTAEAEQTFAEALRVYPRSVFLRTAYASFLENNGREADSEIEFAKALQTNQ